MIFAACLMILLGRVPAGARPFLMLTARVERHPPAKSEADGGGISDLGVLAG
jgi:hypothetical protein